MFHNKKKINYIEKIKKIKFKLDNKSSQYRFNYPKILNKHYSIGNSTNRLNYINSRKENKKLNKYPSLPNIPRNKYNTIEVEYDDNYDKNKINRSNFYKNEDKKKKIFLYQPRWNYSCGLDNNNIFCLKSKEPKENMKKKTIDIIYQLNEINENEYIKPRMIKILEKNDKINKEVFYQPWKYPNLFEK